MSSKYSSIPAKLYQYPNWELPAMNVIKSHSLLSLSDYQQIIDENQSTIPHLLGLSRPEAHYVLLDENFHQLLIKEHSQLCEYHSSESIPKPEDEDLPEPKSKRLKRSNDVESTENDEYEAILRETKAMEMELDKTHCEQRKLELNNHSFLQIDQFQHGDIIQFRNERLQFSFYVYQARKGTFEHLLNTFKIYVKKIIKEKGMINEDDDHSIDISQLNSTNEYELILIPSIESDGYGIPPLFNDAPLHHFKHLSPGSMYRYIYVQLIDQAMPIYAFVQEDIQLKKQSPTYRSLVNEGGDFSDSLIDEFEDGEEMIIEDLDSFPDAYLLIYDEIITKLNIEWRKIDCNDYCNQYSSMYLLTKWTQQLQQDKKSIIAMTVIDI